MTEKEAPKVVEKDAPKAPESGAVSASDRARGYRVEKTATGISVFRCTFNPFATVSEDLMKEFVESERPAE